MTPENFKAMLPKSKLFNLVSDICKPRGIHYNHTDYNPKWDIFMKGWEQSSLSFIVDFKVVGGYERFTTDNKEVLDKAVFINEVQDAFEAWSYCKREMEAI